MYIYSQVSHLRDYVSHMRRDDMYLHLWIPK